ncbi:MAG: (Fe-S)-binding protein [Planctomycetota bacterium]
MGAALLLIRAAGPASGRSLGLPGPLLHGILLGAALAAFAWILARRVAVLRKGAADPRLDRIAERLRNLLVIGFGQSRQPRYPVAGILHILIFAGFLVLLLRSLTLLGEGFVAGFALPGLGGPAGEVYAAIKDWTALVVLACCAAAAWRRLVVRPARYHDRFAVRSHGGEAYVILGLIATLMVADAVYEGSALAAAGERTWGLPLASAAARALDGLSPGLLRRAGTAAFWLHNLALCFFGCYLPVSKHFHVLSALPNVFLAKLPPHGRIKPPRHGTKPGAAAEEIGVRRLADFTWKHLLDFFSCTDCGRCSDVCPAYATGTPLSPRMISIKCRDEAYAANPVFGRPPAGERPALVGAIVTDAELWACTTCRACEDVCPVTIEYVDKIVDMRRHLVDEGRVPATMQKALASIEKRGNPYGKLGKKRGEWVADATGAECGVRVLARGGAADLCYFTDSATAYDPRLQAIGRAFGRLLATAGADCGTLGPDEVDSGHEARRVGEEGLFEVLRERNTAALGERPVGRIVTNDPHAMNALAHDYEGLETPVAHHSEVLAELLAAGRLTPGAIADGRTYTFHDPCYLGRHNGVYDAPRQVLAAIPGLRMVEMAAARNRSFCCGGGSLYLFHEGEAERRMGEVRLDMAAAAGAQVVVTACPFCLINFEDAIKTTGRAETMEVIDLAELLLRAVTNGKEEPRPA